MSNKNIPIPVCSICKQVGSESYQTGDVFFSCSNCGTEMRFLPAGELLLSKGSSVKKNNGWITKFSVQSPELNNNRAMMGLGAVTLLLTFVFLWMGRIAYDDSWLTLIAGLVLLGIGMQRQRRQKNKRDAALARYPYWREGR